MTADKPVKQRLADHAHLAAAFVCLAILFAFGSANLTADPIKTADYNSWKHIGISSAHPIFSIPQTVESVATRSSDHAPLYFILLNIWGQLTGRDLATLRLLSLFFAMIALAFTFRLALATAGKGAALDAVVLTLSLAYFLYFALEVRMYSLLPMLTAWVAWAYWRVAVSAAKTRWHHWAALLIGAASIINVHYFGFLVLASISLYHLLFAPRDRAWLRVPLVMLAASLCFLPWLPVAIQSVTARSIPDHDVLSLLEALPAMLSVYSNGLLLPWLLVGGLLALRFPRLNPGQRYIAALAFALLAALLLLNEFADLIIARRLRYTIVLMLFWNCALACGLQLIPKWKRLRLPALAVWIIAGALYSRSDDMLLYTNRLADGQIHVPPFQHLLYTPAIKARERDFVVSAHADTPLQFKQFDFYAGKLGKFFALIHMWEDETGDLKTQYNDTRYTRLEDLVDWEFPIWLVYNPAQTDFEAMAVYRESAAPHFQRCKRYVETESAVIDMYLAKGILCELFTAEEPLTIQYAGGNRLENLATELAGDELRLSFLWAQIEQQEYAFSIQIFADGGHTGVQIDDVISGTPVRNYALDISALPPGDYAVNLVVYDYQTGKSQEGLIVDGQRQFQRELEVARFSLAE